MENPEHNFKIIIINNDDNDKNNGDDDNKSKMTHPKSINVKECSNLLQPASLSF